MISTRILVTLLFVICVTSINALPVQHDSVAKPRFIGTVARPGVGDAIDKEVGKAARTFRTSKAAVISISVGLVVAVILLLLWFCGCMK